MKGKYIYDSYLFHTFSYTTENGSLQFHSVYILGAGGDGAEYIMDGDKLTLDYYNEYTDTHEYEVYTKVGGIE